ncbi:hypothetical protein HPB48_004898 [Haemaphysalis longicornis]|uniref:Uncharacterized protein n=1 Tax=Haemaphysalis longicornis TaxID=44386 RepID=A0A9J6GEA0_HAELO|nr:hypothetical protein HPB48_004898 [Haemaphysalis longicornis]
MTLMKIGKLQRTKLIEFCEENLQIALTSQQFERVHRLGRFSPDKCRPIIAKFALFKDKQIVQASAKNLKIQTILLVRIFLLQPAKPGKR